MTIPVNMPACLDFYEGLDIQSQSLMLALKAFLPAQPFPQPLFVSSKTVFCYVAPAHFELIM